MRVVMVSDYTVENPFGGLQTHVYHLAHHLSRSNDVELHLVTFSDRNKDLKIDNINFHFIKKSRIPRIFTIPQDALSIRKKIIEINPDIVHIHGTHYPYSLIAGMVPDKYPNLLTVHGIMEIEYKFNRGLNFFGALLSFFLEKYAFSKIKNIIVCSPPMKEILEDKTEAMISVIPNGIEYNEIENIMPLEPVNYPSILFVGLFEKIKGPDILIQSIPLVKKKYSNVKLYMAGKGSQEMVLKELTKELNIEDNVKFLGYISGKKKYSYYASADICVVPSRYESFGIVILEAMACGTPVIASNVGNIPYLINDDEVGLKANSDDVNDFSEKILYLLENKDLRNKMRVNSRKNVKRYKWDKIASETIALYKKLALPKKIK